ncbi:hypothetical protein CEP52_012864 [Fusarium oligoseptatum]|uniref:Uncharacterized protein n=3 Tax=Fusarium solani species complex TaxID=232080 RepID=A0A428SW85_9HYPO|nr:hypothetical protein CEP52_012864 [Fusarium oligoseptatum]
MPQLRGQTRRQTRSQTRIQALPYRPPEPRSMDNERLVPPLPLHVQRPAPIAPVSPTLPMTPMPPAFLELAPQAPGSTALPTRPSMADILNIDFECPAARLIPTVHLEGLASILGCEITSLQQQRGLVEDQLAERHARRELAKERIADVEAVMNEIGFSPSLTHELAEAQRDADVQQCELESLVWSLIHIDDQEWEKLHVYDRLEFELRRRQLFSQVFGVVYSSGEA